jgi:ERCC4-type nuclease
MDIQIDSREKAHAIEHIKEAFDRAGVKYYTSKLYIADYMSLDNPRIVVDRKKNLLELAQNLGTDKSRFYREVKRAVEHGIHIVVLCEHGPDIMRIEDVKDWNNPLLNPHNPGYKPFAITGRDLMERIYKVHISYGVDFMFCSKRDTGAKIIEILSR